MTASTGFVQQHAPQHALGRAASTAFEPGAVLALLDRPTAQDLPPEAASAWDAAWIACLTNSPRWAETAQQEFARFASVEG